MSNIKMKAGRKALHEGEKNKLITVRIPISKHARLIKKYPGKLSDKIRAYLYSLVE